LGNLGGICDREKNEEVTFKYGRVSCIVGYFTDRLDKDTDSETISDKVKLLSFAWIKANLSSFIFVYMTGGATLYHV